MATASTLPDWRNAAAYQPLLRLERVGFAWEWLRREQAYRAAALKSLGATRQLPIGARVEESAAATWGLHCFENPDLAAPEARPIWRSERLRFVLRAESERCTLDEDAFALQQFMSVATLACGAGGESLLLSDGLNSIRLDVSGASLCSGPVRLSYHLYGFAAVEAPLLVLRRLKALLESGNFAGSLHQPNRRAHRHILLLRANDALAAGANQREIAAELLDSAASQERWRVEASSLRSQVQRLVQGVRKMRNGEFWELLR